MSRLTPEREARIRKAVNEMRPPMRGDAEVHILLAEVDALRAEVKRLRDRNDHHHIVEQYERGRGFAEMDALRARCAALEAVAEAARELVKYCPAVDTEHASEEDCDIFMCKETRAALAALDSLNDNQGAQPHGNAGKGAKA